MTSLSPSSITDELYAYTPVQLTPAMVPAEGCNNLTIWHCCILTSVPLQETSIGCEDGTFLQCFVERQMQLAEESLMEYHL